jgi:UPF0755 protein
MTKWIVFLLILGTGLYVGHSYLEWELEVPGPTQQPERMHVEPGTSVRGVLGKLAKLGVVRDARRAEIYLRLHGRTLNIKAGDYEIPAGASAMQVFELLQEGRVVLEQLTVVEGSTFRDLRKAIERHPRIVSTLTGKSDAEVMITIGHAGEHPEGRFFPDTYRFASGITDVELLKLAYDQMEKVVEKAWAERRENLPVRTPYEALILASIVEKETGLASERPRIAGVFTTRLRKGMRLQSDPTIIYGIGEKYDGDIRDRDLVTDTLYNTYTRGGLPPTPIALPGRESIFAVVKPDETGDVFFVATGDGTGAHYFSRTLEEHNAAVKRYLARIKSQQRPAPRASSSGSAAEGVQ